MVGFDSTFALLIWRTDVPASVPKGKERVAHLITELHKNREKIIIPTPVLTELLVRAGAAGQKYLQELTKSAAFLVSPYDTRAAVEVAAVMRKARSSGNKRGGSTETWAKVNFDRQIGAVCKVEGAHTIYTDDEKLGKFALTLGLKVIMLSDLPIPPSKHPLLDILDDIEPDVPPPPPEP